MKIAMMYLAFVLYVISIVCGALAMLTMAVAVMDKSAY
jgi:hypothetical protein